MTKLVIKELVWDQFNIEHIKKHGVDLVEINRLSKNFILHKKAKKGRYIVIGRVDARIITLIVRRVSLGKYYPVSVRDAAKKERKKVYEKEN